MDSEEVAAMFEPDPVITTKVDALIGYTERMGRGKFLSHEQIEKVSGEKRYLGHWPTVLSRFSKYLLAVRGMTLHNERGQGYWLATVRQQLHVQSEQRVRRAMKQNFRMGKTLDAIPQTDMTLHQSAARKALVVEARRSYRDDRHKLRVLRTIFASGERMAPRQRHRQKSKAKSRVQKTAPVATPAI